MNRNPSLKKIGSALVLVVLFLAGARAQDVEWPVTYYTHRGPRRIIYPDVRKGYIVTSRADTVRGFVKLSPSTGFFFEVLDTGTKTIRQVPTPAILFIRVYNGTMEGSFSDYYNLPYQNSMWLLLAQKNNISIYRRELDGSPSRLILVMPDDKRIKILSGRAYLFRNNDEDALLVHFIKKRYKILVKQHFASIQDIYSYILDRENERINRRYRTS